MPSLERTLVRQFEMPGETDRVSLDRMCSSYGFVASKFLFAFQTRELRGEVRDFRAFRNRLVAALGKKPVEFNHKLADLRTNGKAAEASLLTLLRELKRRQDLTCRLVTGTIMSQATRQFHFPSLRQTIGNGNKESKLIRKLLRSAWWLLRDL